MNEIENKFRFKITVIGDGQVGKTSLIQKFTMGIFNKDYVKTIGAQFSTYDKQINGDRVRLILWDIAGQDDFNFLRPYFYRDSIAAIIVFSLEENDLGRDSFSHISNWHKDVNDFCGDIPIVLFANKVDLIDENSVDSFKIKEIVDKYEFLDYYITSAKTGQGVMEAFSAITNKLYEKFNTER
ncbi:MAG: Rab family GTPase [Candidatus Thorarchaeota archaeon]